MAKKLLYVQKLNEERNKIQEDSYESEYLIYKSKFDMEYLQIYEEISKIIDGSCPRPEIKEEEFKKYQIQKSDTIGETGIPDYWYNVVKNSNDFFIINEKDDKILKHLKNIKLVEKEDKLSFTIEFHFNPNDYFTDSIIYKTYNYNLKTQTLCEIKCSTVNWKSEDAKPNKIRKVVTKKSNIFHYIIRG